MRELRGWLITLLFIVMAWVILFGTAGYAVDIPADEPPDAFGVGPMYLLPLVFLLLMITGSWLSAALIRACALVFQSIIRP